jgi:hypothetical protein
MELSELVADRDGPPDESAPRRSSPAPVRAPVHGPNPFGPRPATVHPAAINDDSALAAYNRMLAQLAQHHPDDQHHPDYQRHPEN